MSVSSSGGSEIWGSVISREGSSCRLGRTEGKYRWKKIVWRTPEFIISSSSYIEESRSRRLTFDNVLHRCWICEDLEDILRGPSLFHGHCCRLEGEIPARQLLNVCLCFSVDEPPSRKAQIVYDLVIIGNNVKRHEAVSDAPPKEGLIGALSCCQALTSTSKPAARLPINASPRLKLYPQFMGFQPPHDAVEYMTNRGSLYLTSATIPTYLKGVFTVA